MTGAGVLARGGVCKGTLLQAPRASAASVHHKGARPMRARCPRLTGWEGIEANMGWIVLEALAALAVLLFFFWWVLSSGKGRDEDE